MDKNDERTIEILYEEQKTTQRHRHSYPSDIQRREPILLKRRGFNCRSCPTLLEEEIGQKLHSGRVVDYAFLDVEVAREGGKRAEDQELKPEEEPMHAVEVPEASVIRYIACPDPPDQNKDAQK